MKILDNSTTSKPYLNPIQSCWLSLDFLERILSLAELHRYDIVRNLFELPVKQSPEIITLGLAQVQAKYYNSLHRELISHLLIIFFSNHTNSSFVLQRVWACNRNLILQGMLDLYRLERGNLSRILEIAQDLKVLTDVLHEASSFLFMIDLAALAARREFLYLEKWLPGHIQKFGEPFIRACLYFLKENCGDQKQQQPGVGPPSNNQQYQLNSQTIQCFTQCIQNVKVSSPDLQEEINVLCGHGLEQKVSGIFQQIYRRKDAMEAVKIFTTFKTSRNPDDVETFDFMIDTLFQESQYLHTFPEDLIAFTGELFGSFIQYQIFDGPKLIKALKIIYNSLLNPPLQNNSSNPIFQFGLTALEKFKNTLNKYQQFCNELQNIPNLLQTVPALGRYLTVSTETLLENSMQQNNSNGGGPPIIQPDQEIQEKVAFIFNNVSLNNLNEKANELKSKISNEIYYAWLAKYLIVKRVCIEENFHHVYLKLLNTLQFKNFDSICLNSSIQTCKTLLQSENLSNPKERDMLKSMGNWLGCITLAKNEPILQDQLDLKYLLLIGYQKGKLIPFVSFVSKILYSCKNSKIFRPPNAYVMLLARLLAEIYHIPNIVLKITFEIEILFNTHLSLDIKTIKPTNYLSRLEQCPPPNPDISTQQQQQQQLSSSSNNISQSQSQSSTSLQRSSQTSTQNISLSGSGIPNNPIGSSGGSISTSSNPYSNNNNIPSSSSINSQQQQQPPPQQQKQQGGAPEIRVRIDRAPLFVENPHFIKAVHVAIDKAYFENVDPLLNRYVSIACNTTFHLATKDFANEPSKQLFHEAAHLMVKNLVGNLISVTCPELLRKGMEQQLNTLLRNPPVADSAIISQNIEQVCNDNIEMICHYVEYRAMEQATISIEKRLQSMPNTPIQNPYARYLPPYLYDPKGLQIHQRKVYEDFGRTSNFSLSPSSVPLPSSLVTSNNNNNNNTQATTTNTSTPGTTGNITNTSSNNLNTSSNATVTNNPSSISSLRNSSQQLQQQQPSSVSSQQQQQQRLQEFHEKFKLSLQQFEQQAISILNNQQQQQPSQSQQQLKELVHNFLLHIMNQAMSEETCLRIAETLFSRLYPCTNNETLLEVYSFFLCKIAQKFQNISSKITDVYKLLPQERKFDRNVTSKLINFGLLLLPEFDSHIATLLNNGNQQALDFIYQIIRRNNIQPSKLSRSFEVIERNNLTPASAQQQSSSQTQSPPPKSPRNQQGSSSSSAAASSQSNSTSSSVGSFFNFSNIQIKEPREINDFVLDNVKSRNDAKNIFEEWCKIVNSSQSSSTTNNNNNNNNSNSNNNTNSNGNNSNGNNSNNTSSSSSTNNSSSEIVQIDIQSRRNFLKNPILNALLAEYMAPFFAICTTFSVQNYLLGLGSSHLDCFAQLIFTLFEDILSNSAQNSKVFALGLINIALTSVAFTLESNFTASQSDFNQQPYYHLFSYWLNHLIPLCESKQSGGSSSSSSSTTNNSSSDLFQWQLLCLFSTVFQRLQPNKIVGFCFSWVELISHRHFMPKLLNHPSQKGQIKFQELLVELFQFLEPYLRNLELSPVIQVLYNGTLRVLLVLVHDFPEFLCDYHFAFCDVIPPSCIQMRNLILSAYPRNMRLPDPATPDLKIDRIEDIHKPPTIKSSFTASLQRNKFISDVDSFLETRNPSNFLHELRSRLLLPPQDAYANDTKYNVPLINSLVLYIGIYDLNQNGNTTTPFDIFRSLSRDLDAEGRYWMLNAIANQLRYPNNQTYHFSGILLRLFSEATDEFIKEQITRFVFFNCYFLFKDLKYLLFYLFFF